MRHYDLVDGLSNYALFMPAGYSTVLNTIYLKVEGGGGVLLNFEISLFRDTFYLNKLSSETTKGTGKSIHFLKAFFKTSSEI